MNTTGIDPAFGGITSGSAKELGRDEFLKLLVAKLENQDPLSPSKDTEFVAQLATFSSLEQLIGVNDRLEHLAVRQDQLVNSQALNLVGKSALVEAGNQLRVKNGQADGLVYAIPRPASEVTMTIRDASGAVVRTLELETQPNGRIELEWDGKGNDGEPLPDGDYRLEVQATDTNGEPMAIALFRSLPIDGVSFLDGFITLISGDREIPFDTILEIREQRA